MLGGWGNDQCRCEHAYGMAASRGTKAHGSMHDDAGHLFASVLVNAHVHAPGHSQ